MGALRLEITERDKKIINILKKIAFLREDILSKYLGLEYNSKKTKDIFHQLAGRLKKHEIISRQKIFHGGSFYWCLAKYGAQMMHGVVPKKISLMTIEHDDYVAELVIKSILENPDNIIETEYEIKQTLFGKEAREKKIPDIILNEKTAIEVELSTKDNRRNISLINNYNKSNFEEIIYYSNSKRTINNLQKLTNNYDKFMYYYFMNTIENSELLLKNLVENNNLNKNKESGRFESNSENLLKDLNIL